MDNLFRKKLLHRDIQLQPAEQAQDIIVAAVDAHVFAFFTHLATEFDETAYRGVLEGSHVGQVEYNLVEIFPEQPVELLLEIVRELIIEGAKDAEVEGVIRRVLRLLVHDFTDLLD